VWVIQFVEFDLFMAEGVEGGTAIFIDSPGAVLVYPILDTKRRWRIECGDRSLSEYGRCIYMWMGLI
jgi:hypothetical protein